MKSVVDLPWLGVVRDGVAKVSRVPNLLAEMWHEIQCRALELVKHPDVRKSFRDGLIFNLVWFFMFPYQEPEVLLLLWLTPLAVWYVYHFRSEQNRILSTVGLVAGGWLAACCFAPFIPAVQRLIGALGDRAEGGGLLVATGIAVSVVFGILVFPAAKFAVREIRAKRPGIAAWQAQKVEEVLQRYVVLKRRAEKQIMIMAEYSAATVAPHEFFGFTQSQTSQASRTKSPELRRRLQREKWLQWVRATREHEECYKYELTLRKVPRASTDSLVRDLVAQAKKKFAELE